MNRRTIIIGIIIGLTLFLIIQKIKKNRMIDNQKYAIEEIKKLDDRNSRIDSQLNEIAIKYSILQERIITE